MWSSILSQLLNTLIGALRTLPNIHRHQSLRLILATRTLTSTLSSTPNLGCRSEVHAQTELHLPHTADFTSGKVGLEGRWAPPLLVLDIDATEALSAAIGDLVAFVDVDESSEADAEPFVGAHEVALCDAFSILGEDETAELVDREGEIGGCEGAGVGVEVALEGVDVVEGEEGESFGGEDYFVLGEGAVD